MIAKIQPPNPNIFSAVAYNERKMDGAEGIRPYDEDPAIEGIEDGHVLATRNVPEGCTLVGEFDRLKELNRRLSKNAKIRNTAFHMSVNPSETDRELSEEEAVRFIDELMAGLGYKEQPYRIYKHTDIGRMHYHVVSCRTGQDGKKINDSFERMVLRNSLKSLAYKYGYTVILNESEKKAEELKTIRQEETTGKVKLPSPRETGAGRSAGNDKEEKKKGNETGKPYVPSFDRKSEIPVSDQLKNAFEDCIKWRFSTFEQFQALMLRRYNVLAEIESGTEDKVTLCGTSPSGVPVTPPIREAELGLQMLRLVKERAESSNMASRKEQKKRLETLARAAAEHASTYEEFRAVMEKKGVYTVLSWSADGKPFGVTWLDRATKCAWKGSETSADMKWLTSVAERKGWTLSKDRYQSTNLNRKSLPSRRKAAEAVKAAPAETGRQTPAVGQDKNKAASARTLLAALTRYRAGGRAQDSGSAGSRGKKRDIWEEALEAAERDEMQRKQKDKDQTL